MFDRQTEIKDALTRFIVAFQESPQHAELIEAVSEFYRLKRLDAFACAALQGFLSAGIFTSIPGAGSDEVPGQRAAAWAYEYADAMEAERAKRLAK